MASQTSGRPNTVPRGRDPKVERGRQQQAHAEAVAIDGGDDGSEEPLRRRHVLVQERDRAGGLLPEPCDPTPCAERFVRRPTHDRDARPPIPLKDPEDIGNRVPHGQGDSTQFPGRSITRRAPSLFVPNVECVELSLRPESPESPDVICGLIVCLHQALLSPSGRALNPCRPKPAGRSSGAPFHQDVAWKAPGREFPAPDKAGAP